MDLDNLFKKYLTGKCTEEERRLIEDWLQQHKEEPEAWKKMNESDKKQWLASLYNDISGSIHNMPAARIHRIRLKTWLTAAASLIFIFATGIYLSGRPEKNKISKTAPAKIHQQDVTPGGNKAVLRLADGSEIILDSLHQGIIAHEGNTEINKVKEGQLAYNVTANSTKVPLVNTIIIPRGGQYQVVLPDGSRVWLNASSSLKFPTAFTGRLRKVELTGEGYFEVAKNKSMPFIVTTGNMEVKVLGTHFNVNAYADEPSVKTTLLEGSVQISQGAISKILNPGQQAEVKDGKVRVQQANTEQAAAWKNGMFIFRNSDLAGIMRQLERWYDIDVEGEMPDEQFNGIISRNANLSQILRMIEVTSDFRFKIEGRRVSMAL